MLQVTVAQILQLLIGILLAATGRFVREYSSISPLTKTVATIVMLSGIILLLLTAYGVVDTNVTII